MAVIDLEPPLGLMRVDDRARAKGIGTQPIKLIMYRCILLFLLTYKKYIVSSGAL